jgi:hypothetical protein
MKQKIFSIFLLVAFVAVFTASALTRYLPSVIVPNTTNQPLQTVNCSMSNTIAASAYEFFPFTNVVTITNAGNIASLTNYVTNVTSGLLDCRQQQNLGINVQFQVVNPQSTNHTLPVVFTFVPSIDGIVPDTTNVNMYYQMSVTPLSNGTVCSYSTNWGDSVMGACGYFFLQSISNTCTNSAITNIQVQYSGKTANTSGY